MSHRVYSGYSHSDDGGGRRTRLFDFGELIRNHGKKAVVAIVFAAMFAFAPLALLYFFNELYFQSTITSDIGKNVVVKPGRHKAKLETDQPGKTALLQVICEVPSYDGICELLCDEDPAHSQIQISSSIFVRREAVYLRRAGHDLIPFGYLGKPPVSAWVPAGDYEILVVHEAPDVDLSTAQAANGYPLVSVWESCSLESKQKTVCRIALPHFNHERGTAIHLRGSDGNATEYAMQASHIMPLVESCENSLAIPTPGGYVLAVSEPNILHESEHRGCLADMQNWNAVPREWTRDQLVTVRNWLPADAESTRAKLTQLIDNLQWREYLAGWFCYVVAGVTGLVFTRWGAIALVEPWRRSQALGESFGLLVKIFLAGMGLLFLYHVLTD